MRKKGLDPDLRKLLPPGNGWLVVEFGGRSKEEADETRAHAWTALKRTGQPPSMKLYDDPGERGEALEGARIRSRRNGKRARPSPVLAGVGGRGGPAEKLGNYLRDFRKLLDEFGLIASLYGHFGQGCIHCRISFDLFTREGIAELHASSSTAPPTSWSRTAAPSLPSTATDSPRRCTCPKMYGQELMEAFREFKDIWDPDGKMNPGKLIDPYRAGREPALRRRLPALAARRPSSSSPRTRAAFPRQRSGAWASASAGSRTTPSCAPASWRRVRSCTRRGAAPTCCSRCSRAI